MRSWLSIAFASIGLFLISLSTPSLSRAAVQTPSASSSTSVGGSRVGTHLYNFDPGSQMVTLQKIKDRIGELPKPYPIVLMVSANNPGSYSDLLRLAADPQLIPIVRIVDVTPDLNPSTMAPLASVLNAAHLPPGTAIELGNEIENTDTEWKSADYTNYGALFDALANASLSSDYKLGISSLNTSNANVDVTKIIPKIAATITQKSKITAVFANAYQLSGCAYAAIRCSEDAGSWLLSQMNTSFGLNLTSDSLYITEFGILTCSNGDFDCEQNFYQTYDNKVKAFAKVGFAVTPGMAANASSSEYQHTLPAVCEYWKIGTYAVSKPNKCKQLSGGGIYIYPGIEDQKSEPKQLELASHYTMSCGPQYTLDTSVENQDHTSPGYNPPLYTHNFTCPNGGPCVLQNIVGTLSIDQAGTTIPLYRFDQAIIPNTDTASRRLDDLEGFFSAKYKPQVSPANAVTTAPDNFIIQGSQDKAVNTDAQCNNSIQFLKAIKKLCDNQFKNFTAVNSPTLTPPQPGAPGTPTNTCPLNLTVKTPSGDKSYLNILTEAPADPCSTTNTSDQFHQDLTYVENTTPKAFKPAYIVHYTDFPTVDPTVFDKAQSWFSPEPSKGTLPQKAKNRLQITKVYVPANIATITNSDASDPSLPGLTGATFTSGMMSTILSVTSTKTQKDITDKQNTYQSDLLKRSLQVGTTIESPYLDCPECVVMPNTSTLAETLIKRINAEINWGPYAQPDNLNCSQGDIVGETATVRSQHLNPPGNPDPIIKTSVAAKVAVHVLGNAKQDPADYLHVRTFLLLPDEYLNITDYGDVLARTFLPTQYTAKIFDTLHVTGTTAANSEIPGFGKSYKYLQLSGTTFSLDSGKQNQTQAGFTTSITIDPITGRPTANNTPDNISGQVTSMGGNPTSIDPMVPGGRLARGIWEIACHVLQPLKTGQVYSDYSGLEKLLTAGSSACFKGGSNTTVPTPTALGACSPTVPVMSCHNWRPNTSSANWTASTAESDTACVNTPSSGGTGQSAQITAGVVSLAIKVGNLTCLPPEILIGVMAKESSGLAEANQPYSGDPSEVGTINCVGGALDPNNNCGAFSYNNQDIDGRFKYAGNPMASCLQVIGLSPDDHDQRKLGVSMCAAGVQMWNATQCSSYTSPRTCGGNAGALTSLPASEIANAIMTFHANVCGGGSIAASPYSNALGNYLAFIDQYRWYVDSSSCRTSTVAQ